MTTPAISLAAFTPGAIGIWTLVAIIIVALIKGWPALKKIQAESDSALRTDLLRRIDTLETRVADLEKLLTRREMEHAAAMEDVQHELANETQSLDSFILLAEANPERVLEQLPKIKELRARHKERVALRHGARSAVQGAAS